MGEPDTYVVGPLRLPRKETFDAPVQTAEIEALFRTHSVRLGRFLIQIVSDRTLAEDLLQDTFLAALKDHRKLDGVEHPEAWLFAMARNRALDALRKGRSAKRLTQRLGRERPRHEPDPADGAAVRDFLAQHLEPDERILLVLRYLHGFNSNDLSLIVGGTPESVRQQLSRCRRRLIARLEESDPKEGQT